MIHLTLTWPMLWRAVGHLALGAAAMFLLDIYFEARCEGESRGRLWALMTSGIALLFLNLVVTINGSF